MGMQGRVEHLSSGKATTFHSLEELRAFMERIVAELCVEHPPRSATTDDATCNGIDDDCSGAKDEDFVPETTACAIGACAGSRTSACVNGAVQAPCLRTE